METRARAREALDEVLRERDVGLYPKLAERRVRVTTRLDGELIGDPEVVVVGPTEKAERFEQEVNVRLRGKRARVTFEVEFDPPLYGDR